jgi:insulysin
MTFVVYLLVVLGSETLDELQHLVEELFLDVDNRDVVAPFWDENPYGQNELKTRIEMVPVKDIRHLSVMFPVPDTTPHYKSSVIIQNSLFLSEKAFN